MKKILIALLKYGISLAILAWLFYSASRDDSFAELRDKPKHWGLLAAAFTVAVLAVVSTIVRWYLLVRALGLPFTMRDAFRLGFLGYLFNFFSLGVVGGDLMKAVFIARQQPGRRAEAVATVFIDRVIGLYALFIVATVAFLALGTSDLEVRDAGQLAAIQQACQLALIMSIVGAVGFALLLTPGFTTGALWDFLVGIPRLGPIIDRLISAVRIYRRRKLLLLITLLMSFGTHTLFATSVYLTAHGLPGAHPSFALHFVIVPIAMLVGAVPLPGGLGAFEFALDFLYRGMTTATVAPRQGFVVALAFLIIRLLIAVVGLGYYLADRRQVTELIHEAEQGEDAENETGKTKCSAAVTESSPA